MAASALQPYLKQCVHATINMACLERASPAIKHILLKLLSDEKPVEIDHNLYEFGSVTYHIKASVSDPQNIYLSISIPTLSPEVLANSLPQRTLQAVKSFYPDIVEVTEQPKEGFLLTLRINIVKIPRGKDFIKVISEISSIQTVILSSQLKDILWNLGSLDISHGINKPIKLVYHPREPFFVIRMTAKISVIFPMRFRDDSDVVLATAFFQEMMDICSSSAWSKAPTCTWAPIPPPELRGEPFEDLSTNGGFMSFDILTHHVEGKRLDKIVWNLQNFHAYVKYHVKSTRGLIQRSMMKHLEDMTKVVNEARIKGDEETVKVKGCQCMKKLVGLSNSTIIRRQCSTFTKQFMRIHLRIKIQGFNRVRRKWLKLPKFTSLRRHNKLD